MYQRLSGADDVEEDALRLGTAAEGLPQQRVQLGQSKEGSSYSLVAERGRLGRAAKMDNPLWFLIKAVFVYMLVFLDIFLNSSVNNDDYENLVGGRLTNFWPFLFLVVQTSVQLFIFLTLFLLMCNTYLMQIGLPGVVLADFKYLALAQLIYLILTIVLGSMRIIRFEQAEPGESPDLWGMPGFQVVFIFQNLSAGLYYHQVLYSTFRLADEKYYTRE